MYFFFHLFAGAVIGLLIGDILHDRRWVLLCTFGAVIPDIIDKTVGLLVFGDIFGYGRIFSHTLLAALALLVAGVATWKWLKSPIVMGIAVGVISHQVLDLMWRMPKIWLYPLYGPFQGNQTAEFLFSITLRDLKNPSEILLALLLFAGVLLVVYRDSIRSTFSRHTTAWRWLVTTGALGLGILSAACGLTGYLLLNRSTMKQTLGWITRTGLRSWTGWFRPEEYFIGCILFFLAAYLLWRWRRLAVNTKIQKGC
ncbi:MAG: metal-dependent hydrolase [Methanoregula sp.]|nr:metal-dependent hydrolase [Methanoregula sp.]